MTRIQFTRRHKWLLACGLLLLVIGICWIRRTPEYKLQAEIPVTLYDIPYRSFVPSMEGFIIRETETRFVMRDWQGKEKWQVTTAQPKSWRHKIPRLDDREVMTRMAFAESPNGRYFVSATYQESAVRLQIWKDGIPVSKHDISTFALYPPNQIMTGFIFPLVNESRLTALNSGQIYLQINLNASGKNTSRIFVIEDQKVVAKGDAPTGIQLAPDGKYAIVTEGQIISNPSLFYSVSISNGKVCFKRLMIINECAFHVPVGNGYTQDFDRYPLYADGIYEASTKRYGPPGLSPKEAPHFLTPALIEVPGGRLLLEVPESLSHTNLVRIISTNGRRDWAVQNCPLPYSGELNIVISQTGDYVLIPRVLSPVQYAQTFVPYWNKVFRYVWRRSLSYELYQYPGQRKARMRLTGWRGGWGQQYERPREKGFAVWKQYDLLTLYPSPDGRTLAAIATNDSGKTHQCLIFKW